MGLLSYIINDLSQYLVVAAAGGILIIAFYVFCYGLIYKKLFKGTKVLNSVRFLFIVFLALTILFIVFVTCLQNIGMWERSYNLSPFMSYRQAMFDYSVISVRQLLLNIILFIPFGLLLPLCNKKFEKAGWTLLAGFIFTLCIELAQLIFAAGVFDVDDIFNNVLGTIIGYSITTTVLCIISKEKRNAGNILKHIWPVFTTALILVGLYTNYLSRDYGNLSETGRVFDFKGIQPTLSYNLKDESGTVFQIYYPLHNYSIKQSFELAEHIFDSLGKDTGSMDNSNYDTLQMFRVDGAFLELDRNNGATKLFVSDRFDPEEESRLITGDRQDIFNYLESINVFLPDSIELVENETGKYTGSMDMVIDGDNILNGIVSLEYYDDKTVKFIDNHVISYKKGRDVVLISEYEAYQRLIKGEVIRFVDMSGIDSITVTSSDIAYIEDTKGVLQPVYSFHCKSSKNEFNLLVEAIKK